MKPRVAAILGFMIGLTAMMGWIFDIPDLTSFSPEWALMRRPVAACIMLICLGGYVASFKAWMTDSFLQGIIGTCAIGTLAIMTSLSFGLIIPDGHWDSIAQTHIRGEPAKLTMFALILSSVGLLSFAFNGTGRLAWLRKSIGPGVALIGGLVILGYGIDLPVLRGYVEDKSSAMSFPTAVGLLCIGCLLYHLQKYSKHD